MNLVIRAVLPTECRPRITTLKSGIELEEAILRSRGAKRWQGFRGGWILDSDVDNDNSRLTGKVLSDSDVDDVDDY